MIRLVLFDIDGTLIQTNSAGVKAFARAFQSEFGFTDGTEKMKFAGRTDTGLVREFFNHNGVNPDAEHFRQFFDSYVFWLDHLIKDCNGRVIPGVWDFINALKNLPEPPVLGLLTGNIRLGAEIKLRHFGLWDEFQTGAFADDHEERDRIAGIAKERGSRLFNRELRGNEVLVIGDTPLDIRCGRAIGAKVLAVATGGSKLKELQEHKADWVVEDLRKANAQQIISP
jgi:phosphoglycolate phosphatase